MSFYWKPYVPVAMKREKALNKIAKLKKQGVDIQPVNIQGRKISQTFWGSAWCDHIEKFCDADNRLARGKTYVRNGSVCHLAIEPGRIYAKVSGSELYNIEIQIKKLVQKRWKDVKKACSGKIGSILELLQGKLSSGVMQIVTEQDTGLMPRLGEMSYKCDCPDWADMCKHVAAVLYGVGARLDTNPELFFELRDVDSSELVDTVNIPDIKSTNELQGDLSSLFGVEIESLGITVKKIRAKSEKAVSSPTKHRPARNSLAQKPLTKKTHSQKETKSKKVTGINPFTISKPKIRQAETSDKPFKPTKAAIKLLRKKFGLNKSQFARLIVVSPSTVSVWEDKPGRINLMPASKEALMNVSSLTKEQAWKRIGLKTGSNIIVYTS